MGNKYQREIEEILENMERDSPLPAGKAKPVSKTKPLQQPEPVADAKRRRFRLPISAGHVFFVSLALLLSALLLRPAGLPGLVSFAVWGAIVLFIVAYAMFFIQPHGRDYQKRWRGRPVDAPGGASGGWRERVLRLFRR